MRKDRMPLTIKEGEAVLFMLAEVTELEDGGTSEAMDLLLATGAPKAEIVSTGERMAEWCYPPMDGMEVPVTDLERLVLKTCFEKSEWISAYRNCAPTRDDPTAIDEALSTLRGLAAKLDACGIEVDHIPFD